MSFQSLSFFAFLAVTAAVCLPLRKRSRASALMALELPAGVEFEIKL